MYTVHNRTTDFVDVTQHVEGLRDGWQDRLVKIAKPFPNKPTKQDKATREGYLLALRVLLGEFTPRAYMASEPVIRFEAQLAEVVARIQESEG